MQVALSLAFTMALFPLSMTLLAILSN